MEVIRQKYEFRFCSCAICNFVKQGSTEQKTQKKANRKLYELSLLENLNLPALCCSAENQKVLLLHVRAETVSCDNVSKSGLRLPELLVVDTLQL